MRAECEARDPSETALEDAPVKRPEHSAVELGSGWMSLIYRIALTAADDSCSVRNESNSIRDGFRSLHCQPNADLLQSRETLVCESSAL
jgi:hypothetical protein